MTFINPENIPKKIEVNGIIADYLIRTKKLPFLGRNKERGTWYFADTFQVNIALNELPFYLKLFRNI